MMNGGREAIELELLLLKCKRGDGPAWEQLIRQFERSLFYYVRRITNCEADAWDALQETWLRVHHSIDQVSDSTGLKPWLYRVARNTTLNRLRGEDRYHAKVELKGQEEQTNLAIEDESIFRKEDAEVIHTALAALPLPDREVLTLYFVDDLSVAQLAEVLDAPIGTVKSRLHYAKKKLRQVLKDFHD